MSLNTEAAGLSQSPSVFSIPLFVNVQYLHKHFIILFFHYFRISLFFSTQRCAYYTNFLFYFFFKEKELYSLPIMEY